MQADKIDAKKGKQSFFYKASSFDLNIFVFWNIQKVTSSQTIKKIYPKSESKMDIKNHKKSHCNLTTGQFLFSKYMTIKGLYILNNVRWFFY